jgi:exodeoxyribonuclease III
MRIATWNINGVDARRDQLVSWLKSTNPDIVALQELKATDKDFPVGLVESLGYRVEVHGQKGLNGVALLSKRPLQEVRRGLPGDESDRQARYIEAVVPTDDGILRIGNLYAPNGNPVGSDKFAYKLAWLKRLEDHAALLLGYEEPFVLLGDFNIIPTPNDAKSPKNWQRDALYQPECREAFRRMTALGYMDAVRADQPGVGVYTYWDYWRDAWPRNSGIRIDHILLSEQAASRFVATGIDKHTRGWDHPSDHVPVWVELGA